MKKMILPFFILTRLLLTAQDTPTKITGVGKLKLGDSISLINNLGYPIVPVRTRNEFSSNKSNICQLIADTNSTSYQQTLYAKADPRCQVFVVPKINIGLDIEIVNVQLYFYNDILVKIVFDANTKITEAMTLKYGKPSVKSWEREGDSGIYEDVTYYQTWKLGETEAYEYLNVKYSKDHEKSYTSSFQLSNEITMDMIDKESKLIEERAKQRELEKKKKSIEGF
jgi:hypothetical protein